MKKQELEGLSEDAYLEKLDKATHKILDNFFENDNEGSLPCIMVIPHKYGVMLIRKFPKEVVDKIENDEDVRTEDLAHPLLNALAHVLDLEKANVKLHGRKLLEQTENDMVAYEVLAVLLAEVLAGGRMKDIYDLANCRGMRQIIQVVEEAHEAEEAEEDDDDDDDECESCSCGGICIKGKGKTHRVRGMEMKLNDLSPRQMMKLLSLLTNDDISDEAKVDELESMLKEYGAKPISKDRLEKLAKEIEKEDK